VLHTVNKQLDKSLKPPKLLIIRYTEGLKAMLDVLPENTEHLPAHTIDHYLWVIENLLSGIYDRLDDNPEFNPDQIINEFESSRAFTNLNNSQQ